MCQEQKLISRREEELLRKLNLKPENGLENVKRKSSRTNLEGGTGLCVDVGNEGLLGEGVSAEGRRVIHGAPFAAADEVRGGVELKF